MLMVRELTDDEVRTLAEIVMLEDKFMRLDVVELYRKIIWFSTIKQTERTEQIPQIPKIKEEPAG